MSTRLAWSHVESPKDGSCNGLRKSAAPNCTRQISENRQLKYFADPYLLDCYKLFFCLQLLRMCRRWHRVDSIRNPFTVCAFVVLQECGSERANRTAEERGAPK